MVLVCIHFVCLLGFMASALTGQQVWFLLLSGAAMIATGVLFPTRARLAQLLSEDHRATLCERLRW